MLLNNDLSLQGLNLVINLYPFHTPDEPFLLFNPAKDFTHKPHITSVFPVGMVGVDERDTFSTAVFD